jgi:hypothetical protein
MKNLILLFGILLFAIQLCAQNYVKVNELYSRKQKTISVNSYISIVDIKSVIEINFNKQKMQTENVSSLRLKCYIVRDGSYVDIPNEKLPLVYWEIFPRTNPLLTISDMLEQNDERATQLTISNAGANDKKVIDLKNLNFIKEGDLLKIIIEPNTGNSFSYELETLDLGLTWPKEIGLPLMVSKTSMDSSARLNVGVSGIWHINTRKGLQNYLGFGLTVTPNNIDLSELKNANIGIIPTLAIGFGRKNPDIIFLGAGYVVGQNQPIYYASLNLSWLTRIINK